MSDTVSQDPRVSFIVAAFNAATTITETIESVLAQSIPAWELIVVDDGSTDSTADMVSAFASQDTRIHLLRQSNAGTAAARNSGCALARGGYWVFLDADDMVRCDYVERQLAFAEAHPGFDIYSCNAEMLLASGDRRQMWRGPRYSAPFSLTVDEQLRESSIPPFSMTTRSVWELTGGFRDLYCEDYDFWLRALILGARHLFNPEVLAVYRRHEGTKTRQLVAEAESFLQIQQDALAMPELSDSDRRFAGGAIEFSKTRIGRRRLEERLLAGTYEGSRSMYWRYRAAFPDPVKYWTGFAIMTLSPRLYARIKARRMV